MISQLIIVLRRECHRPEGRSRRAWRFFGLIVIFASAVFMTLTAFVRAEVVDRVVAVVGGEVITLRELDEFSEQFPDTPREKALELLIEDTLIGQEAKKQGITVTDSEVESSVQSRIAQLNVSEEEFKKMLQDQGLTMEQFKDKVRQRLMKFKFVEHQIRGQIEVSDEEILNYYRLHPEQFRAGEQIHLAHIFLPFPLANDPEQQEKVRKLAAELRDRIVRGEDFVEIAKKYSQLRRMTQEGKEEVVWDIGWLKEDDMDSKLRAATAALAPGSVSMAFETDKGLHILKVMERKGAEIMPLAQVKQNIYDRVYDQKIQEELYKILQDIKDRTPIERKL